MKKEMILRNISSPIPAGCLAVITGDGLELDGLKLYATPLDNSAAGEPDFSVKLDASKTVEIPVVSAANGHTLTFEVPNQPNMAWAMQAKNGESESNVYLMNVPDVTWLSLDVVAPGDELRAFGTGLVCVDKYEKGTPEEPKSFGGYLENHNVTVLVKDSTGKFLNAPVTKASSYDVRFLVPEDAALGTCEVYVHAGLGGANGWSKPLTAEIAEKTVWPQDVFNVLDFGAEAVEVRDVYYTKYIDNTPAFQAALDAADKNGGGIVYVPNGRYCFKGELRIGKYVTLRGQDRKRVWFELPKGVSGEDGWGTPEEGMQITTFIGGQTDFAIENISIMAVYNPLIIAAPILEEKPVLSTDKFNKVYGYGCLLDPDKFAKNITIRNCYIVHEPAFFSQRKTVEDPVFKDEKWDGQHRETKLNQWSCLTFKGDHIVIEDNDIKGAGNPIVMLGATYTRISNNILHNGSYTSNIVFLSSSYNPQQTWHRHNAHIIVEDNLFKTATNLNRSASWIMESHSRYYLARNVIEPLFWPSDAEGLNFHTWGVHYIVDVAGKTRKDIKLTKESVLDVFGGFPMSHAIFQYDGTLVPGALKGYEICTINGKGMGQYRNVVDNTLDTIILDGEWDTELDETTKINVGEFPKFHYTYFIDNEINECGRALYYWGSAYESVMDGNKAKRNSGILMEDLSKHYDDYNNWHFAGHFYNQIINNSLVEPRGFCSNYGVIGASGGKVASSTVSMIIRGNLGEDDAIITACPRGTAPDGLNYYGVVLENNHNKNCDIGIEIHENIEAVLKNNTSENVDRPVVGLGKYTKVID